MVLVNEIKEEDSMGESGHLLFSLRCRPGATGKTPTGGNREGHPGRPGAYDPGVGKDPGADRESVRPGELPGRRELEDPGRGPGSRGAQVEGIPGVGVGRGDPGVGDRFKVWSARKGVSANQVSVLQRLYIVDTDTGFTFQTPLPDCKFKFQNLNKISHSFTFSIS
ncbi:hypothetical protein L6452_22080 [Arctium lappa]|uniref:Uncharacterized protein n=1 Tax=Arctium lappa TaxID=4217 RepID=A0ACB9AY79_ARCLA|nr:hypothetical protein L6452_22080 [Arctium lappa]